MLKILITGATDGIGKQTALELADKGHQLILHGRNKDRALAVVEEVSGKTGNQNIEACFADFARFDEIERMADQLKKDHAHLDVLLNNAGVLNMEKKILPNGLEETFMVNHLSHFSLTLQLLPLLLQSGNARIVNVSSQAQSGSIDFDNLNGEKSFDGYQAYGLSKLANCLFTYKLARELSDTAVSVHALHPGVIATKLLHAGWGGGGSPKETGARSTIYAILSDDLNGLTGQYIINARIRKSSAISYDTRVQDKLWEISLRLCGLTDPFA